MRGKKRAVSLAVLLLIVPALLLCFAFCLPAQYGETYLAALTDKAAALDQAASPKIVLVGGSGAAFGFDCELLEEQLPGYRAVNFGLYAGLGTAVMLELALPSLSSGDIVIFSPELSKQTLSDWFDALSMWQAAEENPGLLLRLNVSRWQNMLAAFPQYAAQKARFSMLGTGPDGSGIYARSSFTEKGDIQTSLRPANQMPGGWDMNMPIKGWNECLITYILAASSPTHTVNASVYHKGWAGSGSMRPDYNDPLFFAHYSFLGIDPHGLKDSYGDYWAQNVAHTRRNYEYCVSNPQGHAGYSASCWGLTASDIPGGYSASSPRNDLGVIAPTAALSSIPYTPEESLAALHEFYYVYGDRLWGEYGFHDAFCLDQGWFAPGYISIDQGPIMVMIENYRTGLPWSLLMKDPDISAGLSKLGFSW